MDDEDYRRLRDECDNYSATVHALLAFSACVVHDGTARRPGSHFGLGRRMETSPSNLVSPSETITPDLVAQRSRDYGIVGEIKASLGGESSHWDSHISQLRKYDDDLTGWWTTEETIPHSDTLALLHQSRARAFIRRIEDKRNADSTSVGPTTSVIEFNRSDQAEAYYFFRREWGEIREEELASDLEDGVPIPIHKVLGTLGSVKFYDSPPPLPFLLQVLWLHVFPAWIDDKGQADPESGEIHIRTTIDEVTEELQRAYGSKALELDGRSAEFPRTIWVRDALEALVATRRAYRPPSNQGAYIIRFRAFRTKVDVLRRFIEMTAGQQEAPKPEQTELPLEQSNTSAD